MLRNRSSINWHWLALAVALCAAMAGSARADERGATATLEHRRGVQAFADGRYREAIESFRKADELRPSPAISFNVARAYEALGDPDSAINEYREYLRRAPRARDAQKVQQRLRQLEQEVEQQRLDQERMERERAQGEEQRLAAARERRAAEVAARARVAQQLNVRSTPAGASVSIDGKPLGLTPYSGTLAPGSHTVELRMAGYSAAVQRFELSPEAQKDIAIVLSAEPQPVAQAPRPAPEQPQQSPAPKPLPPEAAELPAPSPDDPSAVADDAEYAAQALDDGGSDGIGTAGVFGWIAAGGAAAALGGALTFELLRQEQEERAREAVTQIGFHNSMETMHSQQTAARVLLGVGGGLAMLGSVLLIVEASGGTSSEREGLSAQLMLGPRNAGARLWARF